MIPTVRAPLSFRAIVLGDDHSLFATFEDAFGRIVPLSPFEMAGVAATSLLDAILYEATDGDQIEALRYRLVASRMQHAIGLLKRVQGYTMWGPLQLTPSSCEKRFGMGSAKLRRQAGLPVKPARSTLG